MRCSFVFPRRKGIALVQSTDVSNVLSSYSYDIQISSAGRRAPLVAVVGILLLFASAADTWAQGAPRVRTSQRVHSHITSDDSGGQETHGDDPDVAEFIDMGRLAVRHLMRLRNQGPFQAVDPVLVSNVVERGFGPQPVRNIPLCAGQSNLPACYSSRTRKISFSRPAWREATRVERFKRAIHEYLRAAHYNALEDNHTISTELVRYVGEGELFSGLPDFCPPSRASCTFSRSVAWSDLDGAPLGIEILPGQSVEVGLSRSDLVCPVVISGYGRPIVLSRVPLLSSMRTLPQQSVCLPHTTEDAGVSELGCLAEVSFPALGLRVQTLDGPGSAVQSGSTLRTIDTMSTLIAPIAEGRRSLALELASRGRLVYSRDSTINGPFRTVPYSFAEWRRDLCYRGGSSSQSVVSLGFTIVVRQGSVSQQR